MPLLFATCELRIALIDDHVKQCVAHLLGGDLAQVLPFAAAFEVAELNFFSLDCAVESIELEAGDFVTLDADLFAPVVEHPDPFAEGSDFGYFSWHKIQTLNHRGHRGSQR